MKSYDRYQIAGEHAGLTVEAFLKQIKKYSGRAIQRLTRQKGILLNGKTVFLKRELKANDIVLVLAEKDYDFGVTPERGRIEILYEDEDMLVLNKPPYQLVHPTGQTTGGTLANFLAHELMIRGDIRTIRPINRLDRDTSGCVAFSKSAKSQALLEAQLNNMVMSRLYLALVYGIPKDESGTITAPIALHPNLPNRRVVSAKGETAVTHYRTITHSDNISLVELKLDTGRTHQIRVHLAYLGTPVIGDGMYGKRSSLINRQALHAVSLSFRGLDNDNDVLVKAPLPDDLSQALECSIGSASNVAQMSRYFV